jgi:hypothetical protein
MSNVIVQDIQPLCPVEVVRSISIRPTVILPRFGNSRNVEMTLPTFFRFAQMAATDGDNSFSREAELFPHPAEVIGELSGAALTLGATLEILEQRD